MKGREGRERRESGEQEGKERGYRKGGRDELAESSNKREGRSKAHQLLDADSGEQEGKERL